MVVVVVLWGGGWRGTAACSDLPSVSSDGFGVVDSWMLRGEIRDKQTGGVGIK